MSTEDLPGVADLPIACTLGVDDGAARLQRWKALSAKGSPIARRTARGLVVRYRSVPGVREELDGPAAAESQCCSFARWLVSQEEDHVVLHVAADASGIATLAGLFGAE